jgi:antitoxin component YwqK of YwqJK toxin-antitoxin module
MKEKLKDTDDGTSLINKYDNSNPPDGWFRQYWENGNPRYEWKYKNGKRVDGISKGWWENGDLKQTVSYKDGKKDGLHIWWYYPFNGQIISEQKWKGGKIIYKKKWDGCGIKILEEYLVV